MATLFKKQHLLTLLLLLTSAQAWSQVNVSITATPPFRPQLSGYETLDFSQISVTLTNTSPDPLQLTLKARLNRLSDNYTIAQTNVVSQPIGTAITLAPLETKMLNQIEVEGIFRNTRLQYDEAVVAAAATSGVIPQGEYEICVIPFDNNTLQPLADEQTCCSNPISISFTEPPQIISVNTSECGEDVQGARQLSSLIFTWSPSIMIGTTQPQYRFQLYEMLSESVNSDNQVFAGNPIIDITGISIPSLYINPNQYNLLDNVRYIFRIQAYDPTETNVFQNDGYSQSCTFRMTPMDEIDDLPDGIVSNYSSRISFPQDLDTLPYEIIPIVQTVSPQNRALDEIKVAYQMFNVGIPELGDFVLFDDQKLEENNPNDRYSLSIQNADPVNSLAYGDVFNITTATSFTDNNNLLPSGNILNQTFVSGMTKPNITQIQRRGTRKNQFKIRYLPGRPPSKLLPDDIGYIIENDKTSFPTTFTVNQKLCIEYKNDLDFEFPDKLRCKAFNYTYDLNTVTEEQILSDLYSLKEWDFELPDSSITGLRIGWLTDPNDTTSIIINASDIHIVNRDNINNISACMGVASYDGFHVGDTVCIAGGILLKVLEIEETNDDGTYNGRGWVHFPVWNEKFMIDFENLQVEAGGTVIGGTAEAVNAHESLIPKSMTPEEGLAMISIEENRKTIFNSNEDGEEDEIATTLPYRFDMPGTQSKFFLWKLVFDKDSASAFTYYQMPMFGDTLEFVSFSKRVKPSCDNEELMKLSLLSDYNIPMPGSENNKISIRPNLASGTSSYVQFACDGIFRAGRIAGMFHLDSSLFTNAEGSGEESMEIPFDAAIDKNGNFMGSIEVPQFKPGGMEYLEIDTSLFVFDFSATENYSEVPPPVASASASWEGFYAKDITARFTQVFKNEEEEEQEEVLEINVPQLSVSETHGFNTKIFATNLIPYSRNWKLGGWRYSLDTINIEFKLSELYQGYATGKIKTPVDTGSNKTSIRLGFEKTRIYGSSELGSDLYFEGLGAELMVKSSSFNFNYQGNEGLELELVLNTDFDTKIKSGDKTILHAVGSIERLAFSNIPGSYVSMENISFDQLQVLKFSMGLGNPSNQLANSEVEQESNTTNDGNSSDENPLETNNSSSSQSSNGSNYSSNGNNSGNTDGTGNNGSNGGRSYTRNGSNASDGSETDNRSAAEIEQDNERNRDRIQNNSDPMSQFRNLPPLEFVKREVGEGTRYELHFRGAFELPGQEFLQMGGRGNWGFICLKESGDIEPYFPELNQFGIAGELGPVKFSGECEIYYNDNTYGDGFVGNIDASFDMGESNGLYIGLKYQSGEVNNFDYWYFKGKTILPVGIPIPPALSWKGAGLEIGKNITVNSNEQVTPQMGNLRFGGEIIMTNAAEGTNLFRISGGISAEVTASFGINQISVNAEIGLMGSKLPSENPSTTELILNAEGDLTMDFREGVFTADIESYLSIPDETGNGVLVKGSMGGNKFGNLDLRISSNQWHIFIGRPSAPCGVTASMLGMNFNFNTYFMVGLGLEPYGLPARIASYFPNVQPNRVTIENGFAHGASWSLQTGKKEWMCFYGELDFLIGYDIAFGQAGSCPGYAEPGYNGFYATGQMYGAGKVDVGMVVDCWLYEGPVSLVEMEAATTVNGGLPKPTYLTGGISSKYSALGGYLKGSFYFDFSIGDECVPEVEEVESPAVDLVLINDIMPSNGASNISLGEQPMALFNFEHLSSFTIEIPNPDVNNPQPIIRTFRANHDAILYRLGGSSGSAVSKTRVNGVSLRRRNLEDGFHEIQIEPGQYLLPNKSYSLLAESFIEEKINNVWSRAKAKNGSIIEKQQLEHRFTTTEVAVIEPYMVANQFPEPNRSFVYTNQQRFRFNFQNRAGGVFASTTTKMRNFETGAISEFASSIPVRYYAKFTRISDGSQAIVLINGNSSSRSVSFNHRGLPAGELFKMDIIRVPEQCERYGDLTSSMESSVNFQLPEIFTAANNRVLDRFRNSYFTSSTVGYGNDENSVNRLSASYGSQQRSGNYWGFIDNSHEDVLYSTYFGKSSHSSLQNKLDALNLENKVVFNFNKDLPFVIQLRENEALCANDFNSNANRPTFKLKMRSQNAYYLALKDYFDDVNELIDEKVLRPEHFRNRNLPHFQNHRFLITQENTQVQIIPSIYNGIVRPNINNLGNWNQRHKHPTTTLTTRNGQSSTFKQLEEEVRVVQEVIGGLFTNAYPSYVIANSRIRISSGVQQTSVQDNNPPNAVNYEKFNQTYRAKCFNLMTKTNLDRGLAGNEGWAMNVYKIESAYQQTFSSTANTTESFNVVIGTLPVNNSRNPQNNSNFNNQQQNWRNSRNRISWRP